MPDSLAVRLAGVTPIDIARREKERSSSALARVSEVLDKFAERDRNGEILTAVRRYPARAAQWADFPAWVHDDLKAAYAA